MESDNNIIKSLKDNIIKLRQLNESLKSNDEELPKEEQESILLQKLVDNFDLILSNGFVPKENSNLPKEKNNYYYAFIIKHFNTPLIRFFLLNNELIPNDNNKISNEKNWILLSILENSFTDCIKEIYKQNLDKSYYGENSLLRKNKFDIKTILKNLKYINFKNIKNNDFESYLEFLKEQ